MRRAGRVCPGWTALLDGDALDLVADLDAVHDIHSRRDHPEVRVLLVEERGVLLTDEELTVVVERRILTARDTHRADRERQVVVLTRHAAASRAVARRIAALDHPVLDAVERQVVVEPALRLADE